VHILKSLDVPVYVDLIERVSVVRIVTGAVTR